MAELINFRLDMTQAEVDSERSAAEAKKEMHLESIEPFFREPANALVEERFIRPVSIMGTATIDILADRIVNHWLKDPNQGVQIDFRSRPVVISRLADVPAGFLVVFKSNGEVSTSHREAYASGADLTPVLQLLSG